MNKTMKLMLASVLTVGMVGCSAADTPASSAPVSEATEAAVADGTYEGESSGFHGPVKVAVTITDGAIADVAVTEANETYGVSDYSLSEMPKRIVEHQTWNVDVCSGATFSANAVKYAVKDALTQAGAADVFGEAVHETAEAETIDTDVVIVGAGIAGVSAAIEAARAGAKVVVLEKLDRIGGSSITSGGIVYGTGSSMNMDIDGYNPEDMVAYYNSRTDGNMDVEMVTYWAEHSGETVDWLIGEEVVFDAGVGTSGISPAMRAHTASLGGGAIMNPLYASLEKEPNITLIRHCPVTALTYEGDTMTGVVADHYGAEVTVNAKAVIIACGGYDASDELMAELVPNSDNVPCMSSCGNTGDEIAWAKEIGAKTLFKGGVMGMHTTDASYTLTGSFNLLSFLPTLGVNDKGERFMAETSDYPIMYRAMDNAGTSCAWWIFDTTGAYAAYTPLMEAAEARGFAVKADTIADLAAGIAVDADVFAATVERYNTLAATGTDEDFGAGAMVPVAEEGPYYAVKVIRSTVAGFGGFVINTSSEVLKEDGTSFPNLWAAGECASGQFFNKDYPCSGSMMSISTTYGRIAGQNAAALALGN